MNLTDAKKPYFLTQRNKRQVTKVMGEKFVETETEGADSS